MSNLSDTTLHNMATYALTSVTPMDNIVPETATKEFLDYACWNWAPTGGTDNVPAQCSPTSICEALISELDKQFDEVIVDPSDENLQKAVIWPAKRCGAIPARKCTCRSPPCARGPAAKRQGQRLTPAVVTT
jgi:hypothetical protein